MSLHLGRVRAADALEQPLEKSLARVLPQSVQRRHGHSRLAKGLACLPAGLLLLQLLRGRAAERQARRLRSGRVRQRLGRQTTMRSRPLATVLRKLVGARRQLSARALCDARRTNGCDHAVAVAPQSRVADDQVEHARYRHVEGGRAPRARGARQAHLDERHLVVVSERQGAIKPHSGALVSPRPKRRGARFADLLGEHLVDIVDL